MVKKDKKEINFGYNLREYWGLLRNYKGILLILLFITVLIEALLIVTPFLFKEIVDRGTLFVSGGIGVSEFGFVLLVVGAIYLVSGFMEIVSRWLRAHYIARLETWTMKDLKNKYFNHIVGLDTGFHATHKTGSLISRLGRGQSSVERITDVLAYNFMPLIIQLVIIGISIAYFSFASTITIAVVTVVFIAFSYMMQQVQQYSRLEAIRAEDIEKATVGDVFTNIDSIKYFGKEKLIGERFLKKTEATRDSLIENWDYHKWMTSGQILIVVLGTLALLYFPLMRFLAGEITIGAVVFIYTVYGNLMAPMWGFVNGMRSFYRSMADFQDLFEYGKVEKEVKDKSGARNLKIRSGAIEFKDVDFRYHKKRGIFEGFNLKIPAKKKYALVGHSGCGKSTLVNLLYRLYDVDGGEILIDGDNVNGFKQESLRSEMAIVPQECVLFDDTIWNNIKFSNPTASSDEVRNAIQFAQLDGIISEMPEKEKTVVGERGVKLSGGEKQRVSIARALLADKKILVLDEATSSLDSETEYEIQRDLEKLMEGRTSIVIAHRLSTIMHADKIIVMKRGKIVQSGRHSELIRQKGEYRKLWNLQKGGYIK